MYFILFYKTVENYIEKRAPFREEHLALVKRNHQNGKLLMAGALAEPADGAVLIFKTDDKEPIKEFVNNDPYVKNGLITDWYIKQWTVVVGAD
jgi:uncharacterized protein